MTGATSDQTDNAALGAPGLVHLVDDDELLRAYAATILEAAGWRTQGHGSGGAFVAALSQLEPGCVLLDIEMPGMNGLQVLDELAARRLEWPVVVLTGRNDIRTAVEAMKKGALDFLQKPIKADALVPALDAALAHLAAIGERGADAARGAALVATLSARELQVLQGMLAGLQNKQIAYQIDLSTRTVEIYRGKVMDKLGVRSLSGALQLALAAGVEPLSETTMPGGPPQGRAPPTQ